MAGAMPDGANRPATGILEAASLVQKSQRRDSYGIIIVKAPKEGAVQSAMATLLGLAVVFLIIALIAYAVGAKGFAGFTMEIAKIIIVVFLILFVLSLLFGFAYNI
jgi:uncharacterized membrane protein YtjA (UPF0391 family)